MSNFKLKFYGGFKVVNGVQIPYYSNNPKDPNFVPKQLQLVELTPLKYVVYRNATEATESIVQRCTGGSDIFNYENLFVNILLTLEKIANAIIEAGHSPSGTYYLNNGRSGSYLTNGSNSPFKLLDKIPIFFGKTGMSKVYEKLYKEMDGGGHIRRQGGSVPEGTIYFNPALNKGACCRITILADYRAHVRYLSSCDDQSYDTDYKIEDGKLMVLAPQPPMNHFEVEIGELSGACEGCGWVSKLPADSYIKDAKQVVKSSTQAIEKAQESIKASKAILQNDQPVKIEKATVQPVKIEKATLKTVAQPVVETPVTKTPEQCLQDLRTLLNAEDSVHYGDLMVKMWAYVRDNNLIVKGMHFNPDQKIRDAIGCSEEQLTIADISKFIR